MTDLLAVRDLKVAFRGRPEAVLQGVDLDVAAGEAVALVGPSGCGKSLAARALLGLLPPSARWSGEILWKGEELVDPRGAAWSQVRGRGMTMILQEPKAALDPVRTVGDQVAETVRRHHGGSAGESRRRALELLAELELPDPERVAASHPHRLSGGQRQRALIAAALACDPDLLIADEPTTALDVVVQKGILRVIDRIRRRRGMALLFISHDRHLVDLVTDRVVTLAEGRAVEGGAAESPATAVPEVGPGPDQDRGEAVLTLTELSREFTQRARQVRAVHGVDLDLRSGEALGIAGRSGCGKTTLARLMTGHLAPSAGRVVLGGTDLSAGTGAERRRRRRKVQMLFQDPGSSLDPRQTIGDAVHRVAGGGDPGRHLAAVGLAADLAERYPHQLSGGQRQRAALARCLAVEPAVIVADEPTSALDHAARTRLLELFAAVRRDHGTAQVIISHDLDVLASSCDRIAVMLDGHVVEIYPLSGGGPRHPYTRNLWASSPSVLHRRSEPWGGLVDGVDDKERKGGGGCPYAVECKLWKPRCSKELPPLVEVAAGHHLRCPEAEAGASSQFIDTY